MATNGSVHILQQRTLEADNFIKALHQPGLGLEEALKIYEKDPELYAQSSLDDEYRGPIVCADMVTAVIKDRQNALVLDVGAGCGRVGEELYKRGFRNLHAHDGSNSMVECCKRLGIFNDAFVCVVGNGSQFPCKDDTYDCLAISGATVVNHLPASSQQEFVRVVRPGGFVVNTYRATIPECDYGKEWVVEGKRLVDTGKWRLYGTLLFPKYNFNTDGRVDIYQVL